MHAKDATTQDRAVVNGLHDAFISYSRKDKEFASRLEKALENHSLPKELEVARHRLDIFRDEEDFTGTEYYQALNKHLIASKNLIVICSPAARASRYVNEEIRAFAEAKGTEHIIPVLISGIPNNEASPSQEADMAFPNALVERMQMPLAISYRGFNPGRDKINKLSFEGAWFSLLANLLGVTRSEIEQREKKRQARIRNYWIAGLASISAVLLALSIWALVERNKAARQRDEALRSQSTFLAQLSREQTALGKHDLGIKLALQALPRRLDHPDRPWIQAAESALYASFSQQSFRFVLGGTRPGFGHKLQNARISPDGLRAALDYGTQVELWNLESGERINDFRSDTVHQSVTHVVFSPDGRYLGISYSGKVLFGFGDLMRTGKMGTERGSVFEIVDAHTGTVVQRFQTEGNTHNHLQFSPSGNRLLIATDEKFLLMDTSNWQPVTGELWQKSGMSHLAPPYSTVAFSDDENKFALVTDGGVIAVLDHTKASFFDLPIQTDGGVIGLKFLSRDGGLMVMASGARVIVANTADFAQAPVPVTGSSKILALGYASARSTIVAITQDARAHSWPLAEERIDLDARRIDGAQLRSARFDEAGNAAMVEFEDGVVEFWELSTGLRHTVLPAHKELHLVNASFDRDGQTALLATSDSTVRIWERTMAKSAERLSQISGKLATAAVFRPRTNHSAIGDQEGAVTIWDTSSGKQIWHSDPGHRGKINCLAFDVAGTRLVSGASDQTAIIWDIAGEKPPLKLQGHKDKVDFCAFSPGGQLIVTGSSDSTFRLWDSNSGKVRVLAIPEEYLDPIHNFSHNAQAEFTSDGKTLVTVTSGDGMAIGQPALVWDVESGKLLHALRHDMSIWDVAITPDDRYVVTTSYDNSVALWDIRSGDRIETFAGHSTSVFRALLVDHGRLLVTASSDGVVRLSRVPTAQLVHEWKVSARLSNMEMSHDGRLLALGSNPTDQEGMVEMWDPVVPSWLMTIRVSNGALSPWDGIAFSPDDRSLLTRTKSGDVLTWSLPPTGQELIDQAWARVAKPGGELLTQEQRIRFAIEPP